jgi:hypothetical protein
MEALKIVFERCIKDWDNGVVFLILKFQRPWQSELDILKYQTRETTTCIQTKEDFVKLFLFTPLHYLLWFSYLGKRVKEGLIIKQDWFKILNGNLNFTFWTSKQEKQQPVYILKQILLSFFFFFLTPLHYLL